jgi:ribosomal protein L37E
MGGNEGVMDAGAFGESEMKERDSVPCRLCGDVTHMVSTRLCDRCWELETRIHRSPELARRILLKLEKETNLK